MAIAGNYTTARPITPNDQTDFAVVGAPSTVPQLCEAIYVGGAGVVALVMQDGSVQNFTCVAGQILPMKARRVNITGTTATLLVALYYH